MAAWKFWRSLLFRMDAEDAHHMTTRALTQLGALPTAPMLRWLSGASKRPIAPCTVWGLDFRTPVGLAAGFDKNAEWVRVLPHLGFGFAEIGTVTPRPQSGNPRPRLFRDPAEQTLFNRMGFNNLGATLVARNLAVARPHLPEGFRVGVNIGKNKDTSDADAADDYARAIAPFEGLADYVVINVSSPNTPGLRALQTAESLRQLTDRVSSELAKWSRRPPLLIKLAPELAAEELRELVTQCESWGIDGWVLTNTWGGQISRGGVTYPGGWSGKILREPSFASLSAVRALSAKPLISVGGIDSAEEARRRIDAGASLVQVYSGWIFRGPKLPSAIARELARK